MIRTRSLAGIEKKREIHRSLFLPFSFYPSAEKKRQTKVQNCIRWKAGWGNKVGLVVLRAFENVLDKAKHTHTHTYRALIAAAALKRSLASTTLATFSTATRFIQIKKLGTSGKNQSNQHYLHAEVERSR